MQEPEFDLTEDELAEHPEPEPVIDFEDDQVHVRDEDEATEAGEDEYRDDEARRIANADLDQCRR